MICSERERFFFDSPSLLYVNRVYATRAHPQDGCYRLTFTEKKLKNLFLNDIDEFIRVVVEE